MHNLHGMPGVFSGVASALAAGLAQMEGGSGSVAYRERCVSVCAGVVGGIN